MSDYRVGESADLYDIVTGVWVGVLDGHGREQVVPSAGNSSVLPVANGGSGSSTPQQVVSDTRVTSGLPGAYTFGDLTYTYNPPSAPSQTVSVGRRTEYTYSSTQSNSGGGHSVANLAYFLQTGSGNPVLAVCHESKYQNTGGGTTTTVVLNVNECADNNGTITTLTGNNFVVSANSGTIATAVGFLVPDMTGVTGITTAYGLRIEDKRFRVSSRAPIADRAIAALQTPSTGQSITLPDNETYHLLAPGGTLATLTVALPANPFDGDECWLYTTQTITALTITATGKTLLGNPTTIAANQCVHFKYFAGFTYWIRLGAVG